MFQNCFLAILAFTQRLSPLQAELHGFVGTWLRCNFLEWMTIPRRYALLCTRKTAHPSLSNCGS